MYAGLSTKDYKTQLSSPGFSKACARELAVQEAKSLFGSLSIQDTSTDS